jgi:hypothetical protein
MTFVLGMRCSNGLVICADMLESDGITKRYRNKLAAITVGNEWGVAWGCSGSAFTCDKFTDKLKASVNNAGNYNRAALENDVEVCLEFIRQSYSAEHGISVVVGIFGQPVEKVEAATQETILGPPEFHLYRGASNVACISPINDYCIAGMDVTLAGCVLANTYHPFIPLEHGKRLGVFITSLMKEHAEGVGGETRCIYYQFAAPGCFTAMTDREVSVIEKTFPISSFDEAITKYWLDFDENRNLEELTQSHLDRRRALSYINKILKDHPEDTSKT